MNNEALEYIRVIACRTYGVSYDEIISKNRFKHLIPPRKALAYFMRNILGYSYPTIGSLMGHRDHTTAMYLVKKFDKEDFFRRAQISEADLIEKMRGFFETKLD